MTQEKNYDIVTGAIFRVGDKPGAGIYRCLENPEFVAHIEDGDELPVCKGHEGCEDITYRRVVDERDAVTPEEIEANG